MIRRSRKGITCGSLKAFVNEFTGLCLPERVCSEYRAAMSRPETREFVVIGAAIRRAVVVSIGGAGLGAIRGAGTRRPRASVQHLTSHLLGAPPGIRTQNLRIKSPLLCH